MHSRAAHGFGPSETPCRVTRSQPIGRPLPVTAPPQAARAQRQKQKGRTARSSLPFAPALQSESRTAAVLADIYRCALGAARIGQDGAAAATAEGDVLEGAV